MWLCTICIETACMTWLTGERTANSTIFPSRFRAVIGMVAKGFIPWRPKAAGLVMVEYMWEVSRTKTTIYVKVVTFWVFVSAKLVEKVLFSHGPAHALASWHAFTKVSSWPKRLPLSATCWAAR
jgi:hypothetical protein